MVFNFRYDENGKFTNNGLGNIPKIVKDFKEIQKLKQQV